MALEVHFTQPRHNLATRKITLSPYPKSSWHRLLTFSQLANMTIQSDHTTSQYDQATKSSDSAETGGEKEATVESSHFSEPTDGGVRAWLVAAGGFCIFFTCLGFASSFGVFQVYYSTHQLRGDSQDKIAWIGSISAFIQFAAGVIGGPMFDRFGAKVRYSPPTH